MGRTQLQGKPLDTIWDGWKGTGIVWFIRR
jgi:hypothetical protein